MIEAALLQRDKALVGKPTIDVDGPLPGVSDAPRLVNHIGDLYGLALRPPDSRSNLQTALRTVRCHPKVVVVWEKGVDPTLRSACDSPVANRDGLAVRDLSRHFHHRDE